MKDWSHKLLLSHERLITQIIIITWKMVHSNYYCYMKDCSFKLFNFYARLDHTNYYYHMKDWSHKLLLSHERLITQIIIITWKIDHTNYYYYMKDGSFKLFNFYARLDHTNYYCYMKDWSHKLLLLHERWFIQIV
jgi:ribosomal protein L19